MTNKASLEGYTPEQIEAMAATYQSIVANPETREMALRATKKANPKLAIPELDTKDAVAAAVKPVQDQLDAMTQERLKKEAEDRILKARDSLRSQGFSDADVTAIEKMMVDDKIASHESAAKHFRAQQQLAEATPGTVRRDSVNYSLPESPLKALKAGRKGLAAWARNEASAAVDDLRAGRVKMH